MMATTDAGGAGAARVDVMLAIVDFPMLSTAFRAVIDQERDMGVVVEATSREAIVSQAKASSPEVIILEYEAFAAVGCGTPEAIEEVRAAAPGARIIALDCRCATEQFSIALKAGAAGVLTREALADDVVSAVRAVAAGHTYVSPAIVTRMVDTYVRGKPEAVDDPYDQLTDRERQILLLAAMGHTNRDIARSLQLSEQTVHSNRANLMEKLGLHDRVELLRYTVRRGLLNPSVL
jgi:two-component system, NarL family, response regulator NreC